MFYRLGYSFIARFFRKIPSDLPLKTKEAKAAHAQQFVNAGSCCYASVLLIPVAALHSDGLESWLLLLWISGLVVVGTLMMFIGGILSRKGLKKLDAIYAEKPEVSGRKVVRRFRK